MNLDDWSQAYKRWDEDPRNDFHVCFLGEKQEPVRESLTVQLWKHGSFPAYFENNVMNSQERDIPDFVQNGESFLEPRFAWGDFLALSYVWGVGFACHPILLNGKQFMVRNSLLEALRRLRKSKEVRDAKLKVWVDVICID